MGNLSIKAREDEESIYSARSPLRNRNILDPKVQNVKKSFKEPLILRNSFLKVAPNNLERQRKLKAETKNSYLNADPIVKVRRKGKLKKSQNEEAPKEKQKKENNSKNFDKKLSDQLEKKIALSVPTGNQANVISDILKMIVDLERTFLEEKKYQRRLRSGFSKQNEKVHHLQLSLHIEKERNKRLMEILSQGDSLGACALEGISDKTKVIDDLKSFSDWPYQGILNNSVDKPISPMLLQQRNDELQNSLLICQKELKRKENQLTLALCKQETLQAKCDKLTEQYRYSQRKLDSLNRRRIQRKWKLKNPQSETSESKKSETTNRRKRLYQESKYDSYTMSSTDLEKDVVSRQSFQLEKTKEE